MKYLHWVAAVALAAFFIGSASAQNTGTVSNHAVAIGQGPGTSGFRSAVPGAAGLPLISNGPSGDPTFQSFPPPSRLPDDIRNFGAVCNSTASQAANNSAIGSAVAAFGKAFIPPCTIYISNFSLPGYGKIYGAGWASTLLAFGTLTATGLLNCTNCTGVSVEDLTIAVGATNRTAGVAAISCINCNLINIVNNYIDGNYGILFEQVNRATISGNTVNGYGEAASSNQSGAGIAVQGTTLDNLGYNCGGSNGNSEIHITGNTVFGGYGGSFVATNVTISAANPAVVTAPNSFIAGDMISFTDGNIPSVGGIALNSFRPKRWGGREIIYYVLAEGLSPTSFEISATRGGPPINTSGGSGGDGIVLTTGGTAPGVLLCNTSFMTVADNVISSGFNGVTERQANGAGGLNHITVTGNKIYNSTHEAVLTIGGLNIVIANNVFDFSGASIDFGLTLDASQGSLSQVSVTGNNFTNCYQGCIAIAGGSAANSLQFSVVSGNTLYNWNRGGVAGTAGIGVFGAGASLNKIGENNVVGSSVQAGYLIQEVAGSGTYNGVPNTNVYYNNMGFNYSLTTCSGGVGTTSGGFCIKGSGSINSGNINY